jgi:hypothetical protein
MGRCPQARDWGRGDHQTDEIVFIATKRALGRGWWGWVNKKLIRGLDLLQQAEEMRSLPALRHEFKPSVEAIESSLGPAERMPAEVERKGLIGDDFDVGRFLEGLIPG